MGELLLVRHGETEWTLSRKHTSYTDLSLTANGEREARAIAPVLAQRTIALTLVSPLRRARRTALLAGLTHAQVEPNLHEWNYGGCEGRTSADIRRERPGWSLWTDGVLPGPEDNPGEGPEQVAARCDRVLARVRPLLTDHLAGDVALVAHGHLLRVMAARQLGLPPSAGAIFRLDTGTVSRLGLEHGRPVVTSWNEALPIGGRKPGQEQAGRERLLPVTKPAVLQAVS
jgi:broad specificity phosphatase PhoE